MLVAFQSTGREFSGFSEEEKAFWSFQPIANPTPPVVKDESWVTSELDQFVLAKLEAAGLSPALSADRRTLLRRLTYDLTGLPPTPAEMEDFLSDKRPEAFAEAVERLLASPRYGERWAQHWLDVSRFAESAGHDGNNAYLHAWRYRDYVIKSLNDDKPYNQFIVEQLAGDLLPATGDVELDYEQLVATGFLQVGAKPVVMRDKRQMLLDIADEQLHATGVVFMGLTLGCARCHDHKFDPVPAEDYYSLAGIFTSTKIMADHAPDSKWVEEEITGPDGEPVKAMLVREMSTPKNLPIHRRGSYRSLGKEVPRRFLQIIAGVGHPAFETADSGRLELAEWVASPDNPLTARVIVNRIWQNHFGRGIVASSGNFGRRGSPPSHPELLDWLASRFVENGWSIKDMHRLIVNSSTYRQAHIHNEQALAVDPDNVLLWKMPRRRLSAEEIRDTLLMASGELDLEMGGTLFTEGYTANDPKRELYVVDISGSDRFGPFEVPRRSIYLPVIRNARPEMLILFDGPHAHESTTVRGQTTVAPQALFMLNSPFVRERAEGLANRLMDEVLMAPGQISAEERFREAVELVYDLTLNRPPDENEILRAGKFIRNYESLARHQEEPQVDIRSSDEYEKLIQSSEGLLLYQNFGGIPLNGKDQRIQVASPAVLNTLREEFTVECWIKPTDIRPHMMILGRDGASERFWKLGVYGREINGQRKNFLFTQIFSAALGGHRLFDGQEFVAPLDQWTHLVFAVGNGERRLYINGELVDQCEIASDNLPTGAEPLSIGARNDGSEWFAGAVNHVSLFEKALAEETIGEHYLAFRRATGQGLNTEQRLAWQAFCQSMFCLNEFVHVE